MSVKCSKSSESLIYIAKETFSAEESTSPYPGVDGDLAALLLLHTDRQPTVIHLQMCPSQTILSGVPFNYKTLELISGQEFQGLLGRRWNGELADQTPFTFHGTRYGEHPSIVLTAGLLIKRGA